jgi:hypothetical protein
MPIRYEERAHRYRITFIDNLGNAIHRIFRGDYKQNHIEEEAKRHHNCTRIEIHKTMTGEFIEAVEKANQEYF